MRAARGGALLRREHIRRDLFTADTKDVRGSGIEEFVMASMGGTDEFVASIARLSGMLSTDVTGRGILRRGMRGLEGMLLAHDFTFRT